MCLPCSSLFCRRRCMRWTPAVKGEGALGSASSTRNTVSMGTTQANTTWRWRSNSFCTPSCTWRTELRSHTRGGAHCCAPGHEHSEDIEIKCAGTSRLQHGCLEPSNTAESRHAKDRRQGMCHCMCKPACLRKESCALQAVPAVQCAFAERALQIPEAASAPNGP